MSNDSLVYVLIVSERHKISDVYVPETPIPRSGSDATSYRSSPHHLVPLLPPSSQSTDTVTSDELSKHIQETTPTDNDNEVSLGALVSVTFGKDVKTVIQNKLFEVKMSFKLIKYIAISLCYFMFEQIFCILR